MTERSLYPIDVTIYLYEIFLSDDKLLESIVVTQEGNDTVIYRLI